MFWQIATGTAVGDDNFLGEHFCGERTKHEDSSNKPSGK
jgi:hypothetical protein